ncbi:ABC transporter permease [Geobacter sp. FeAm09]|uniref:ABC transporter permease n=1 Tax=Geobacter sp. FeAm09 TaxID=2597769 RepID=UPI0011ED9981|nr:ABC transporter permease [Geobacter sp. FeAm09]QEM68751.1 ABC transporter permease [Geobacter sp. FeAm09]
MPGAPLTVGVTAASWRQTLPAEARLFWRSSFGSLLSRESLTVLMPLLILWELLPRLALVPASLVPPPSTLFSSFSLMLQKHHLLAHLGASALRFFLGFTLAVATAFPLGVLIGWNRFIRKHCLPLFQILAPIPPPAWVPVTMVVLGIGLPMQVFLIFLGVFYPVLFSTYQGISETNPRYIASARVFGASEFTIIIHVHIWHALGSVIMGIRIGIALGLVMLVVAEMQSGGSGVGYLLLRGKEYFQIDHMVVCMLILGAAGWLMTEIMKYAELKLAVWRMER